MCLGLYSLQSTSLTLPLVETWRDGLGLWNKSEDLDLVLALPLTCCVTGGSPSPSLSLSFLIRKLRLGSLYFNAESWGFQIGKQRPCKEKRCT